MRSLKGRLIAVSLVWTAVALIAAGLLIAALLREFVERNFNDRLRASMLAVMASVEFDEDTGALTQTRPVGEPAFDQAHSGWYWQVEGEGVRLSSRSLWTSRIEPARTAGSGEAGPVATVANGPQDERLRVLLQRFSAPGEGPPLSVTVAGPETEVERELAAIVRPLAASLVLLGLGLGTAILIQVQVGLRPLSRLQRDLEQIRRGEAERLPDQPIAELAPVAREINTLIAHNSKVIERARAHVGSLAHALQTPLSAMANIIRNPARDSDGAISQAVARMQAQVKHHLKRARAAASAGVIGVRTPVRPVIDDLIEALGHIYRERRLAFRVAITSEPVFAGERQDLDEMLGNLLDNACKWTSAKVLVSAEARAGELRLAVADDGPGLEPHEIAAAIERGKRLDEQIDGSGLGLAIVRDLAELYGGRLEIGRSEFGGLEASLILPAGSG